MGSQQAILMGTLFLYRNKKNIYLHMYFHLDLSFLEPGALRKWLKPLTMGL